MALLEETYSLPRPVVTTVISDVVTDLASAKKKWGRKDLY